jgi:aspartate carbamoyltransferase catalytic subunit
MMMRESVAVSCNTMQLPSNRLAHACQESRVIKHTGRVACADGQISETTQRILTLLGINSQANTILVHSVCSLGHLQHSRYTTSYGKQALVAGEVYDGVDTSTLHTSHQTSLPADPAHTNIKWC